MPKSRGRKHKSKFKRKRTQRRFGTTSGSMFRSIRSKLTFGKITAVTISIIGITSAYFTVIGYWSPRVSVQPLLSMNPKDALSTSFSATNQGAMNIYNVSIGCRFINCKVMHYSKERDETTGNSSIMVLSKRNDSDSKETQIGEITEMFPALTYSQVAPMKSATLELPFSAPGEDDFDIEIIVDYRPAWYLFERRESFRFVSKAGVDGQMHWLPRPDLEPESP